MPAASDDGRRLLPRVLPRLPDGRPPILRPRSGPGRRHGTHVAVIRRAGPRSSPLLALPFRVESQLFHGLLCRGNATSSLDTLEGWSAEKDSSSGQLFGLIKRI